MIKRALISVWDKSGVLELGMFLINNDMMLYVRGTNKTIDPNLID